MREAGLESCSSCSQLGRRKISLKQLNHSKNTTLEGPNGVLPSFFTQVSHIKS